MSVSAREIAGDKYILWGASWSLYTAKVRPYLIKKGIDQAVDEVVSQLKKLSRDVSGEMSIDDAVRFSGDQP